MGERMTAREIKWCKQCLMPSSRPRVVFGDDGICNACKFHESQKNVDWDARRKEFERTVDRFRRNQTYDIIVPCSAGKDSATIAHRLKYEFGLRPLAVCYGQLIWTKAGQYNMERLRRSGVEVRIWATNQDVSRRLARRMFIERGHPKNAYDSAVNAIPLLQAIESNVPLIMFAEMGEAAYGGLVRNEESLRRRDIAEVFEHQVGDDARNWVVDGLTESDLYPYIYPDLSEISRVGVEAHYFSWYFPWSIYDNAKYARDKMGFTTAWRDDGYKIQIGEDTWYGRSDGSVESFDSIDDAIDDLDYAAMHSKFLFGRTIRICSRLIQGGHMTRERGLELAKKYDGEFPVRHMPEICDFLGMTEKEIRRILDLHKNSELWEKGSDGTWVPRFAPS